MVEDLGRGAHGGARVRHRVALLDGDGRRQVADQIHVGPRQPLEELARVGRERGHVATLPLGVERVEGQGRLARARHAGHHGEAAQRESSSSRPFRLWERAFSMRISPSAARATPGEMTQASGSEQAVRELHGQGEIAVDLEPARPCRAGPRSPRPPARRSSRPRREAQTHVGRIQATSAARPAPGSPSATRRPMSPPPPFSPDSVQLRSPPRRLRAASGWKCLRSQSTASSREPGAVRSIVGNREWSLGRIDSSVNPRCRPPGRPSLQRVAAPRR